MKTDGDEKHEKQLKRWNILKNHDFRRDEFEMKIDEKMKRDEKYENEKSL